MRALTVGLLLALDVYGHGPFDFQEPHVVIRSPGSGAFISDRVTIEAQLQPAELMTAVSSFAFFADGREVCRTAPPAPATCVWDAGAIVKSHVIRVVATLLDGRRLVDMVRTEGLAVEDIAVVRIVRVTAVVTSRSGSFVPAIPRQMFHVREDGTPQTVQQFTGGDAPMDVMLALDISASMVPVLPDLRRAVAELVAVLPPTATLSIMGFNDGLYDLHRRGEPIRRGLDAVERLKAWGSTALHDAIIRGLDRLSVGTGRRALVVFTDGEDRASRATVSQVRNAIEAHDATVFFVALGRGAAVDALLSSMQRLAALSGGRALQAERADRLGERFREVVDELSHQYLLGYESTNTALDGRWRAITVGLTSGDLRVRARPGYRAPSAAPQ